MQVGIRHRNNLEINSSNDSDTTIRATIPTPDSKRRRRRIFRQNSYGKIIGGALETLLKFVNVALLGSIGMFAVLYFLRKLQSDSQAMGRMEVNLHVQLSGRATRILYPQELDSDSTSADSADFGPVKNLRLLGGDHFHRYAHEDARMNRGQVIKFNSDPDDMVDYNEAFDDDYFANHNFGWRRSDHRLQRVKHRRCRYPAWARKLVINCNDFHEFDRVELLKQRTIKYVGQGSYRQVFSISEDYSEYVFKTLVFNSVGGARETYFPEDFEAMRMDAMTAEIFTSNPLFVDIYGFCGVSMFAEFMPNGDMDTLAFPRYDRGLYKNFTDEQLIQMNDIHPDMKLKVALQMAQAVAHLHGYEGGVIVHDDIQPPQFLLTKEGKDDWRNAEVVVKLNDFNRGVFMQYDRSHREYCKYRNGPGAGDWRAAEEYKDDPLDEKIDVFSIGMNIYAMVTGLCPFPDIDEEELVQKLIIKGMVPTVDQRILDRSFAERRLYEIAAKCFTYDANERPDIFQVVEWLQEAYDMNRKRTG